ncbi:MAG TPA: hypothetical protein VMZ06_05600, partial [Candidatus Bathyarchaeia archaeon]|nr:hypothetical protein [Candidatus Bathyarchaeia archaeon]
MISLCDSPGGEGGFDTTLAVFDACGGNELACNDDWCALNSLVIINLEAQTEYVIRIAGYGSEVGDYVLVVTEPPNCDQWDPTDYVPSGATLLNQPGVAFQEHGPHSACGDWDEDWFKVWLEGGSRYNFNSIEGIGDSEAALVHLSGEDIDSLESLGYVGIDYNSGGDLQFDLYATAWQTGDYYLWVWSYGDGESYSEKYNTQGLGAAYDLNYGLAAGLSTDDQWDHEDDRPAGASQLIEPTASVQSHGPHNFANADLFDFFKVGLTSGREYNLNSIGGSGDPIALLFWAPDLDSVFGLTEELFDLPVAEDDDSGGDWQFDLIYTADRTGDYVLMVFNLEVGGAKSGLGKAIAKSKAGKAYSESNKASSTTYPYTLKYSVTNCTAPAAPTCPAGPISLICDQSGTFTTSGSTCDAGCGSVEYQFDWGDGTQSGWDGASQSYSWSWEGTYSVKARVRCSGATDLPSGWSSSLSVTIVDGCTAPGAPTRLEGPSPLACGQSGTFAASGSSCETGCGVVQYQFDWGDGVQSSWSAASQSYSWSSESTSNVKARARCSGDTD